MDKYIIFSYLLIKIELKLEKIETCNKCYWKNLLVQYYNLIVGLSSKVGGMLLKTMK